MFRAVASCSTSILCASFQAFGIRSQRMSSSLRGKVALVTGASRGVGKGIAIELGAANLTVYVTGRKPDQSESGGNANTSTLQEVADEITKRGGKGIAVYCDHSKPDEIKALFEQIEKEQNGQLDVLVNNAYSAVYYMVKNLGKKFYEYEDPPEVAYETVNAVGLKNNFICSTYAAKMMAKRKQGVLINISSVGAINYLFNIPYGFGKTALVRMSADMAIELTDKNVFSIALLPGGVQTEIIKETVLKGPDGPAKNYFVEGETIFYAGKVLVYLLEHPELLKRFNGQGLSTTQIADEFNVLDVDGKIKRDKRIDNYMDHLKSVNKVQTEFLPK